MVAPLAERPCTVVDLGAGDGAKTHLLLAALAACAPGLVYSPVDVSAEALRSACERMGEAFPGIELAPVQGEYAEAVGRLGDRGGALLVLFLGGNIGNLERGPALALLRSLRRALRPGDHVLVGFDLLKGLDVLLPAYDDAQHVTAAFNLNLLARMNRELGADLDLAGFFHRATFDPARRAMESWLVSRRAQRATIAGRVFRFEAGEAIHTEISCKYRLSDVEELAREAGFAPAGRFFDRRRWFLDALWRVGEGRDE
jgi:dimethylhistidine N-methyltransferase